MPRPFWRIEATFEHAGQTYAATWFDPAFEAGADEEARDDRIFDEARAQEILARARSGDGSASETRKPSRESAPPLFDLTSLQREANSRFGFSAKATLGLAQALYERHKVLTYPRTDSRALPEDYISTVKKAVELLKDSRDYTNFAASILGNGWIRPNKRVFNNAKVSDHFAIIPTLQLPKHLNEPEQKIYDLVVRRFLAVFFPAAEYLQTTRITHVEDHQYRTEGRILQNPGWLAIYGRSAQDRKSTRLNSSHMSESRMPSSA